MESQRPRRQKEKEFRFVKPPDTTSGVSGVVALKHNHINNLKFQGKYTFGESFISQNNPCSVAMDIPRDSQTAGLEVAVFFL